MLNQFFNYLLILSFICPNFSWAESLQALPANDYSSFILPEKISRHDFEVHLALDPTRLSFVQSWIRHSVTKKQFLMLQEFKDLSDQAFLNTGLGEATLRYEQTYQLRLGADWNQQHRKILVYSALRRAQLEPTLIKKNIWLKRALALSPKRDVDVKLFPPPLITEFEQTREGTGEEIAVKKQFPWAQALLVDGRSYDLSRRLKLEQDDQVHRFTLLSNRWAPITEILTWQGFKLWQPRLEPLVSGACGSPSFHPSTKKLKNIKAFWDRQCLVTKTPPPSKILSPQATNQSPNYLVVPPARVSDQQSLPTPMQSKPTIMSKRHWILVALGASAIALAIASSQKRTPRASTQPVLRDGF